MTDFYSLDELRDVRERRLSPLTAGRQPDHHEHLGEGAINVLAGLGEVFEPPLEWREWHDLMVRQNFGADEEGVPVAEKVMGYRRGKRRGDPNQMEMFDGSA